MDVTLAAADLRIAIWHSEAMTADFSREQAAMIAGRARVAGVDEVGRGPLAGPVVAAASIVAKVMRDRMMVRLGLLYPAYGFAGHVGYGTPAHRAALKTHGPCPAHRYSFAPIKGVWSRSPV